MQRVAGAKAIPDARRADGAPQQARTSPGPQGREGSRRRPARHAADGVQSIQETIFAPPQKGEYGGAGGVEGRPPLSPHAPRRAGDLPPAPGSSRNSGKNPNNDSVKNAAAAGQHNALFPLASGRAALCRLASRLFQRQKTPNRRVRLPSAPDALTYSP